MSGEPHRPPGRPFVIGAMAAAALVGVGLAVVENRSGAAPRGSASGEADAPPRAGVTSVAPASAPASSAPPPAPAVPRGPWNVVLILIDSLRADMPWTGYPRPVAPWLTRFAERSILYPRAYSLSSYTAKSVAPALVGKYPSEMPRDGYFFTSWPEENLFLGERLQQHGHLTLAVHGHGYFMKALGMWQGFDTVKLLPGTVLDTKGVHDVTSQRLHDLSKEVLAAHVKPDQRFFFYTHFLDPHHEYYKHKDHPDFGNGRRDLYDNEVHHTDAWVGKLVDWIQEQPWGKETAIVITADHGEGFGERGHYRHSYELWEALVRVPLLVHLPGVAPRRIEEPRGHIDLAPTLAELLGIPADPPFRGKSLVPEMLGLEAPAPRPVVVDLPRCDLMDRRRAVIDGRYKLLAFGDDRRFFLFDVVADFAEERDLSGQEPEVLARMRALYDQLSREIPVVPVVGGAPLKGAPAGQRW